MSEFNVMKNVGGDDAGFACLVIQGWFHDLAASQEQLTHEHAEGRLRSGRSELLTVARRLELKAESASSSLSRMIRSKASLAGNLARSNSHFKSNTLRCQRSSTDAPPRLSHEVQLLPAVWAVQEQPLRPVQSFIVDEIDVVVTGSDKIVTSEDERLGLVYSARIQLKQNSIQVGENRVHLPLGMAVYADMLR